MHMSENYYKFYDINHAAIWEEANSTCVADGGYLAILKTQMEATVVKYIAFPLGACDFALVYIGLQDLTGQNDWASVHGKFTCSRYVIFTFECRRLMELVQIHLRIKVTFTYSTIFIDFNTDRFLHMA